MRRPIRRAKLLRPQTSERLHLVAAGEKRQFRRIGRANQIKPVGQNIQRLLPFDFDEFARTAMRARLAH